MVEVVEVRDMVVKEQEHRYNERYKEMYGLEEKRCEGERYEEFKNNLKVYIQVQ
jgi:hypothetical protein